MKFLDKIFSKFSKNKNQQNQNQSVEQDTNLNDGASNGDTNNLNTDSSFNYTPNVDINKVNDLTDEYGNEDVHSHIKKGYTGLRNNVIIVAGLILVVVFVSFYFLGEIHIFNRPAQVVKKKPVYTANRPSNYGLTSKNLVHNLVNEPTKKLKVKPKYKSIFTKNSKILNNIAKHRTSVNGSKVPGIPGAGGVGVGPGNAAKSAILAYPSQQSGGLLGGVTPPVTPVSMPSVSGLGSKHKKGPQLTHNESFLKQLNNSKKKMTYGVSPINLHDPYVLMPGMVLSATLITPINTAGELPGTLKAMVNHNVYSFDLKHLLIPAGSFLIGKYASQVAMNQDSVMVGFNFIEFPNGSYMKLPAFEGDNRLGYAGLEDQVNNHYWSIAETQGLLSLISFGMIYGTGSNNTGTTNSNPTAFQTLAQTLVSNLGQTASTLLQNGLNQSPTLKIRPGFNFNIVVSRVLVFKHSYK